MFYTLSGPATKRKDRLLPVKRATLDSWSKYVLHAENVALCNVIKWSQYAEIHAIFHNMTNVPAVQFSHAAAQHMTYSNYYGLCCIKGGVSIMLCSWLLVALLWGRGVSDSGYSRRERYLEAQDKFAEMDLMDGEKKTFMNILDRRYWAKRDAWEARMQVYNRHLHQANDALETHQQSLLVLLLMIVVEMRKALEL